MFFPINIKYSCNSIIAYYKTIKDVHVSLVTIEFGDPHTSFSLPLQPKKIAAWNSPKANKIYGWIFVFKVVTLRVSPFLDLLKSGIFLPLSEQGASFKGLLILGLA